MSTRGKRWDGAPGAFPALPLLLGAQRHGETPAALRRRCRRQHKGRDGVNKGPGIKGRGHLGQHEALLGHKQLWGVGLDPRCRGGCKETLLQGRWELG